MRLTALVFALGCTGSYIYDTPEDPGGGSDDMGGEGDDTGGGGGSGGGNGSGDGTGGGGGDTPPPADFSVEVETLTADLSLGETKPIAVTIHSINDFAGDVTLEAIGLPDSWEVTFSPSPTVTVTAGGTGSAMAQLVVPTDGEATTAAIEVTATGAPGTRMTAVDVSVRPELTLRIPQDALNNPGASLGGTVAVRYVAPGTKIIWINDDTVTHRIHATDPGAGLAHEDDNMAPNGGSYEVTITQPGTYDYSCHIHPQMTGRLVVN